MSRTGWNLISSRFSLTKIPCSVLSEYYRKGYPFTPKMADRPYNQYGTIHCSEDNGINSAGGSQGIPRSGSNSRAIGTTWATVRKPPIQVTKPAALTPLKKWKFPQLQQGLPGTASLPPRLRPQGGPTGGSSGVVLIRSLPTQQLPPCRATSAMRWMTLVTFSIVLEIASLAISHSPGRSL